MSVQRAFRRAILIDSRGGRVAADLEDDFHGFGVTLQHDGLEVVGVEARAVRYPWATCLEAPVALLALKGAPLSLHPTALFRFADPRVHCTHLFELACLAVVQAARGEGARCFEAEVTDPDEGFRLARLFQDGELALEWRLAGDVITASAPYAGRSAGSFGSRVLAELEPDEAERLLILRRVIQTARGREMNVDAYASAAEMRRPAECYSLQPANVGRARRIAGSIRDWADRQSVLRSMPAISWSG